VCISSLEHVGCDNTLYTHDKSYAENKPNDYLLAIKEMVRILKPRGALFLTVPFGKYVNYGSFQVFDEPMLARIISTFGPVRKVEQTFYRYSAGGWNTSTASECSDCEYVSWVASVWSGAPWPNPLPIEPDRAAAARAVACHLVKSA
jgi:hypothetical protein